MKCFTKTLGAVLALMMSMTWSASNVAAEDRTPLDPAQWRTLRAKCEAVLKEHIARKPPRDETERENWVAQFEGWPIPLAEAKLLELLEDPVVGVRLAAGEVLWKRTGPKHRKETLAAIAKLKPENAVNRARLWVLRLRLGEPRALAEVYRCVQFGLSVHRDSVFSCSMHPQVRTARKGSCPICSMDLIAGLGRPTHDERRGQMIALGALAERNDERVSDLARAILTSDAQPHWRLEAAYHWAVVSPREGLPHLQIFLRASDGFLRHQAVQFAAEDFPKQSVDEFKAVLQTPRQPAYMRLTAAKGLVAAGHPQYLKELRGFLKTQNSDAKYQFEQLVAIVSLAEVGTADDLDRLAPFLKTAAKEYAATTILRLMDRLKGQ